METQHDLMKVEEIAALLRTSKMTIYRLIQAGHLDVIKVGRSFRVKRASYEAFMAAGGSTGL